MLSPRPNNGTQIARATLAATTSAPQIRSLKSSLRNAWQATASVAVQ